MAESDLEAYQEGGHTLMGPGSEKIRASLDADGQRGFDAARDFNLSRTTRLNMTVQYT